MKSPLVRGVPSFRDFVDDALFHPQWGYYSTGKVRFGDGGDYDTFPNAVSPLFGEAVAVHAWRAWRRFGSPASFVLAELGAGNGQLCLDVWCAVQQRARRSPLWRRFAAALQYRIFERSPALIQRQRQLLRGSAAPVQWQRLDISRRRPQPLAACGFVVANEVLDCLAHHKLVRQDDGTPGVAFVVAAAAKRRGRAAAGGLSRADLAHRLAHTGRTGLQFDEVVLPLSAVRGLAAYVQRCVPVLATSRTWRAPYFVCPDFEPLMRHTAALFERAEAVWIDYGDERPFHLRAAPSRKVFAGPPGCGRNVYDAPGTDDITFFVDFTAAARAAADGGWSVDRLVPQSEWFAESGIGLGAGTAERIVAHRAVRWLLSLLGVDPERQWRTGSLTFAPRGRRRMSLRAEVDATLAELAGERPSPFRVLVLRRD